MNQIFYIPIYEITHSCYEYEEFTFKHPLLKVDATYIIHLVGNGRYESILRQLQTYPISKKVYIVLNRGYKKCKKDTSITKPRLDLVDAYLNVFKHAKDKGSILILEDDFMMDDKILDPFHRKHVNRFMDKKKRKLVFIILEQYRHYCCLMILIIIEPELYQVLILLSIINLFERN